MNDLPVEFLEWLFVEQYFTGDNYRHADFLAEYGIEVERYVRDYAVKAQEDAFKGFMAINPCRRKEYWEKWLEWCKEQAEQYISLSKSITPECVKE